MNLKFWYNIAQTNFKLNLKVLTSWRDQLRMFQSGAQFMTYVEQKRSPFVFHISRKQNLFW